MITPEIIINVVLMFVIIRGESCKRFRRYENIAVDVNTCRMETSVTQDWSHQCLEECDKNSQVSHSNF